MKYVIVINRWGCILAIMLIIALTIVFCKDPYEGDDEYDEFMVYYALLKPELDCALPNAVDKGATFSPQRRFCINGKLDSGFVYNNATSLEITTTSVANGTQLECRGFGGIFIEGNGWYKSSVYPIPTGHPLIFISKQEVNKDGGGNVISYQPFTNYSVGDTLLCITAKVQYQVVRIQ